MKLPIFTIFCLFLCGLFPSQSLAQSSTLHLIVSIDELNDDIMEGCQKDYVLISDLFRTVAQEARMPFRLHRLPFEIDAVEDFLASFRCSPSDVLLSFFTLATVFDMATKTKKTGLGLISITAISD